MKPKWYWLNVIVSGLLIAFFIWALAWIWFGLGQARTP